MKLSVTVSPHTVAFASAELVKKVIMLKLNSLLLDLKMIVPPSSFEWLYTNVKP